MFGNPNISSSPVDDIYRSQADTYGNSFANPMNPANMNSGWGIDPSLLTPSFTSQYRPGYSGSNGAVAGGRPGFFGGLNNLAPWASTPGWANPDDHQQSSVDSVASRPYDAAMWATQRIAAPVAAFRIAGRIFGGGTGFKGAYGLGRSFGRGFGGGIARGLGAAQGGMMARGMAGAMGGVMGLAAGAILPLAVGQGIMYGAEKSLFDPYINTRRSSENLRDNFAGITFADSQGNASNYGGLSGFESSAMARQLTTAGIKDMSLSTGEYGAAANMVGRSGLTDNVNSSGITKRIKDSVDQMKLIMSIAQMPEMKDAIEQLSKLQRMGANVTGGAYSDAAGTMRQLGGLASVAGTNVQRLMNTVGAQGQYLYQANGMTPYMGQIAAANSFASLSAGNRQGLISTAQLARLGGLEGATQATLTGELNASQTTYNKIANFNKYMGGGAGTSALDNLARFGQSMSRNPMGTQGAMMLYGNQMAANQMNERGSLALDDQVWDMLKNMPGMVDPKTGKIALEKAVPYLTQMGMSNDQIMAYASKRVSETDKGANTQAMRGLNRNLIEQQKQLIEQNTLYGGAIGRTVRSVMKGGRELTASIGDAFGGNLASGEGSLRDSIGRMKDEMWYGSTIKNSNQTVEEALAGTQSNKDVMGFDLSSIKGSKLVTGSSGKGMKVSDSIHLRDLASELNSAKDRGDPNAVAYFKATNAKDRQVALNRFKESGKMSRKLNEYYSDPANYKNIEANLNSITRVTTKEDTSTMGDAIKNVLQTVSMGMINFSGDPKKSENGADLLNRIGGIKGGDIADNTRLAGMAYNAGTSDRELTTSNIEERMAGDSNLQAISKATGITDPQDLLAYIRKTTKSVADNRLVGLTTNSLKVKGSGVEAVKAAGARNGNNFYDENAIDTTSLDYDETRKATMAMKANAEMKGQLYDKYTSGHLDFSGFQSSMNAMDNKEAVRDFVNAVKVFEKGAKAIADSGGKKDVPGFLSFFGSKNEEATQNVIGRK